MICLCVTFSLCHIIIRVHLISPGAPSASIVPQPQPGLLFLRKKILLKHHAMGLINYNEQF